MYFIDVELCNQRGEKLKNTLEKYFYNTKAWEFCQPGNSAGHALAMMDYRANQIGCGLYWGGKLKCSGIASYVCHYFIEEGIKGGLPFLPENFLKVCKNEPGSWATCNKTLEKQAGKCIRETYKEKKENKAVGKSPASLAAPTSGESQTDSKALQTYSSTQSGVEPKFDTGTQAGILTLLKLNSIILVTNALAKCH